MHMHQSHQSDIPQTLVWISFEDRFRAQEFLVAVSGLAAAGKLRLKDAVTVIKDDFGKTVVHETVDPTPGRSALTGAMWAGLFGLILGGPVGWITGLVVGAAARAPPAPRKVHWFREAVQPRTATVALLIEDLDRNALVTEASRFTGAELVYANLDDATIARVRDAFAHHLPSNGDADA
jgi:uncharacterized membrane protein